MQLKIYLMLSLALFVVSPISDATDATSIMNSATTGTPSSPTTTLSQLNSTTGNQAVQTSGEVVSITFSSSTALTTPTCPILTSTNINTNINPPGPPVLLSNVNSTGTPDTGTIQSALLCGLAHFTCSYNITYFKANTVSSGANALENIVKMVSSTAHTNSNGAPSCPASIFPSGYIDPSTSAVIVPTTSVLKCEVGTTTYSVCPACQQAYCFASNYYTSNGVNFFVPGYYGAACTNSPSHYTDFACPQNLCTTSWAYNSNSGNTGNGCVWYQVSCGYDYSSYGEKGQSPCTNPVWFGGRCVSNSPCQ